MPRHYKQGCGVCGCLDELTYTECCDHLICEGCNKAHNKYTVCAYHFENDHEGSNWRTCKECLKEFPKGLEDRAWGFPEETPPKKQKKQVKVYSSDESDDEKELIPCFQCNEEIDLANYVRRGGKCYCVECVTVIITIDAETQTLPMILCFQCNEEIDLANYVRRNGKYYCVECVTVTITIDVETQTLPMVLSVPQEQQTQTPIKVQNQEDKTSKNESKTRENSDAKDEKESGQKYGKRKAQTEDNEDLNRSTSTGTAKKVKKNGEDNGSENKKMIEITSREKTDKLTPSKTDNECASKTKRESSLDNTEGKQTSSSTKKKVQGNKKVE